MIAFAVLHEKKTSLRRQNWSVLCSVEESAHIEASPGFPAVVEVLLEINFMWY